MSNLTINLSKELEKNLQHLEKTTKKTRDFHIKKALVRYLEDIEDISDVEKYLKRKKESKVKYYTTEELSKKLKLDE